MFRPEPGALLVGLVVLYGGAQDHNVSKEPPVGAFFEQKQDENVFSASRLPADNCRMGALGQKMINKQLRRSGHLRGSAGHP